MRDAIIFVLSVIAMIVLWRQLLRDLRKPYVDQKKPRNGA